MTKEAGHRRRGRTPWSQLYTADDCQHLTFILLHFAFFFILFTFTFLLHFSRISAYLHLPTLAALSIAAFFAFSSLFLLFAAASLIYSSGPLTCKMSQRIVEAVADWSAVRTALDVGCGRGVLLNAVAKRIKKEGSSGRVVGVDIYKYDALSTLRAAGVQGVQEYVTCREGDMRQLPFSDNYFDVVVSAVFVHRVGKELGRSTAAAAAERVRVVGEVGRVLKPGGVGVVWDVQHVPEYVKKLQEMGMDEIAISEPVTAFLMTSHIVSFRKPRWMVMGPAVDDWTSHFLC